MAATHIAAEATPAAPTWRRVSELADLVEIYDPWVQVCAWQREIDPAIKTYLSQLHQTGDLQALETLSPAAQPKLDALPGGPGRASLIGDLSLLREVVCELLDCAAAGLRLARVGHAMCPGWHAEMRGEHTPETEEYGISSFVYRARRPFHPTRFAEALKTDWPGNVLRSKGFFWLASRPDAAGEWSQAGGVVRHGPAGTWWAAAPSEHWPQDPEHRARIEAEFDGAYGDRRQEIVFIGQHLEPEQTRQILDRCLLTDVELAAGPKAWRRFDDPFPQWFAEHDED